MNTHRFSAGAFMAIALVCGLSWNSAGIAHTRGESEQFDASYVDINTGRTGPVQISVTRWALHLQSAPTLQQTLFKKGQDALLEALRDMRPVGRISTPGSIGYDLRFAEQRTSTGRRTRDNLASDRPMSFWEIVNKPRSSQYPFTWLQFRMRGTARARAR